MTDARHTGTGRCGSRVLAVDVGAGTADALLTLPGEPLENAVRLVAPSRTQVVGRQIAQATAAAATVIFHGPVMGGGASVAAMKRHVAAGLRFVAGESAALTFADDLGRVRALGVEVVGDDEAAALAETADIGTRDADFVAGETDCVDDGRSSAADAATPLTDGREAGPSLVAVRSGDLDPVALRTALRLLGVEPRVDAVCVAVQDHGFSPGGSNRACRFALWERAVAERCLLADLFYERPAIPARLTRLRAAADLAADLAVGMPVLVADTGPAALYGALPDAPGPVAAAGTSPASAGPPVAPGPPIAADAWEESGDVILVNVGNAHVICVVARGRRLAGVFEHHTARLDGPGLEQRLREFLAGKLTSTAVREDGGHGAVLAPDLVPAPCAPIIVTGPRRDVLRGTRLPLEFAAPHGDMMLTGCYGLLRAARERGLVAAMS